MSKHSQLPWTLEEKNYWPFDITIKGPEIPCRRWAYSTSHKTIEDVMECRGFAEKDRDDAIKANALQMADLRFIVAACNAFDPMREALEDELGYWNFQAQKFANDPADHHEVVIIKKRQIALRAALSLTKEG